MAEYLQIIIKTYKRTGGASKASVRAHPIDGQGIDTSMNVECSSRMRKKNPVGTLFLLEAKVVRREGGTPFLYAHHQAPYKIVSEREARDFLSR